MYTPAETHSPESIGTGRVDAILVEFKAPTPGTASLPVSRVSTHVIQERRNVCGSGIAAGERSRVEILVLPNVLLVGSPKVNALIGPVAIKVLVPAIVVILPLTSRPWSSVMDTFCRSFTRARMSSAWV